jgi:hypothetical protein
LHVEPLILGAGTQHPRGAATDTFVLNRFEPVAKADAPAAKWLKSG